MYLFLSGHCRVLPPNIGETCYAYPYAPFCFCVCFSLSLFRPASIPAPCGLLCTCTPGQGFLMSPTQPIARSCHTRQYRAQGGRSNFRTFFEEPPHQGGPIWYIRRASLALLEDLFFSPCAFARSPFYLSDYSRIKNYYSILRSPGKTDLRNSWDYGESAF